MGTGLTDFISIDEVRQEIDSTYPNPGRDAAEELKVKNNGYGHRLIGNAFEFLCELLLYRRCEEIVQPWRPRWWEQRRWTNGECPPILVQRFDGMRWEEYQDISSREEWEEMNDDLPVWERRKSAVKWKEDEELSKVAEQYVQTGMNTEAVVKAALVDAGWKPDEAVHSWVDREAFEEDVLSEMNALFDILRAQDWVDGNTVFHQPKFGNHQHILAGEGDIIVDDILVDIKTTENPKFKNGFWRQLLMYYMLTDIQRTLYDIDGRTYGQEPFDEPYPKINRVGIYFARFGELKEVDMREVIEEQQRYEEFRAWIVDRAIEENRHAQHDYSAIRAELTDPYDYRRQQTFDEF
jgi:hypothetical protein